ncbi:hypothetical protein RVS70_09340 [Virgibacillus sp. M23]|uniref:hypothetical protein n=1 Tax=Virgibacillus sp. M23 TaxID=3079030 RepID=UPI002A920E71|nr:hypothetical protein [Virgibacillus sp. M23]MDY7044408.1 hypothetical protein [Virgibacillus sp. M23]
MDNRKLDRLIAVNKIIHEIANRGRRFFYDQRRNRYAQMVIEKHKVFFIDDYTGERVYAYNTGLNDHRGFSHGGTMWGLINDFREFIVTGNQTNGNNGYGGLYCPHWGYPEEDMKSIRAVAKEVGFLKGVEE